MYKAGRRAFSLLEVIVCMAIVAVIVGLTLSAIQSARSAALQMKSANKLRQNYGN